jgi:4-amino-4-deoxy-L-arabinose transferase-like glycosyltransferase
MIESMSVVGERLADRGPRLRDAAATPRSAVFALTGITVVAALIRFLGLTRQSIWVDEASTMAFTQRGFHGMLHLLVDYEANALVYYVLIYPVTLLDGGLAPLRAVSALAGVIAIPALYWAARPLVSRAALLVACGALCLNAHAVTQSQNARPYALALLVTIVSYGFLARACAGGGTRTQWLLYIATTALVIYLNALCGLVVIAAQVIVPLAAGRAALRRWLPAVAAIVLAAVPLAVLTAHAASGRDVFYWVTRPGLFELARAQVLILGGPVAAVCAVVVLACAVVLARARLPRTPAALVSHPAAPVVAWAFAPIVVLFALSMVKPVFSDTYLAVAVPGLCLALGVAVVSLPRRLGAGALVLLLASLAFGVAAHAREQYREDWRTPIRELAHLRAPGDPVLFDTSLGLVPAGYYDPSLTSHGGRLFVSQWHDGPMPAGVTALQSPGGYFDVPFGPPSTALVQRLARRTGRLFVVISHTTRQGDILRSPALIWVTAHCSATVQRYKAVTFVAARACPR